MLVKLVKCAEYLLENIESFPIGPLKGCYSLTDLHIEILCIDIKIKNIS